MISQETLTKSKEMLRINSAQIFKCSRKNSRFVNYFDEENSNSQTFKAKYSQWKFGYSNIFIEEKGFHKIFNWPLFKDIVLIKLRIKIIPNLSPIITN